MADKKKSTSNHLGAVFWGKMTKNPHSAKNIKEGHFGFFYLKTSKNKERPLLCNEKKIQKSCKVPRKSHIPLRHHEALPFE